MRSPWKWLTERKLRVDILTIFAILITFIFLAIIGYTYVKTSRLILNLGDVIIEKYTDSLVNKFDDYVSPSAFFDYSTVLLNDGWLDNSDTIKLSDFMQVLLKTHTQLTSAYIADGHDNMFIESRIYHDPKLITATEFITLAEIPNDTQFISESIFHKNGQSVLTATFKNAAGLKLGVKKDMLINYKPHEQPWFFGALNSSSKNWVVVDKYRDAPGVQMTVSQAITFQDHHIGVIAADVNIDVVTHYLQQYRVSKHSQTFIVDHAGRVIATLAHLKSSDDVLPRIADLNNPKLITVEHIFRSTGKRNFNFELNGVEYLAKIIPYALVKNVGWEIITIVPTSDFIGNAKKDYQNILLVSFLMLFTGLLLVLIFSYKISNPIMKLAKDTEQINNLIFDKPTIIKSHIFEIQVLTNAFNATKKVLSSFSKYLPKALTYKLIHAGTIANVGGERKIISILFSDIKNFTTIAEGIPPETLMSHISEYLNIFTQVIHQYQGNVDKFIGDAVMAFWGAPLDDPDYAEHACLATLMCHYKINKLNQAWEKMGNPVFHTRFGLNLGIVVVGNMGSFDRLNYTAIGDEVNLASRLEKINKLYGTQIIVSEAVYHACKDKFLFRPVDTVLAKGKTKSTAIYELMASINGPNEILATGELKELAKLTNDAFEAYHAKNFDLSKSIFTLIMKKFPNDPIASFYMKRIS